MRILNLARRFSREDWGGTETVMLETSKSLMQSGHDVQIFATLATATKNEEDIEGVPVSRFPYFYPYLGLSKDARAVLDKKGGSPFSFSLMRAIAKIPELDIIHIHAGNRIGGIGRHIARKRKIPYLITLHGGVFNVPEEEAASWSAPAKGAIDLGKPFGWWVGSRRLLQDAAVIICVDRNECASAQAKLPGVKVIHIPNGVDTDRFQRGDGAAFRTRHKIPADATVVLTVARIDSQKNQKMAVRILPALLRANPKAHLLLVGAPTNAAYLGEIREMVSKLDLQAHVTIVPGLPGTGTDIVDAYHAADIFFLPSRHETFGIVILEAWAASLPVVASNIGGIPTLLHEGTDGFTFQSGSDELAISALCRLLNDSVLRQSVGEAGKKKANKYYSWTSSTQLIEGLYEGAIRENPLRK